MKFSIAYAAKWGHALHVELTFAAADGYQDTMDLPMRHQGQEPRTLENGAA